jgi:2'-hydroxyisoflavone reductase
MHILVLGGTAFVGRAIAVEAVSRDHEVTLLNRGTKSAPAGTKTLVGDRLAPDGLSVLRNLSFDAVIDTWAEDPVAVTRAVEALRGRIGHCTYISTANVYDGAAIRTSGKLNDETTELFDVDAVDAHKSVYQFNKRSGEIEVEKGTQEMHIPAFLPRPGVILGPYEASIIERGRLTWWSDRLHRGGPTVAPGPKELPIQFVDVRDLADFVIDGVEKGLGGGYNIVNGHGIATIGNVLATASHVTGDLAKLVWKTPKEILDAGIVPFSEMPLWQDPESRDYAAVFRLDTEKALMAGLKCRPFGETAQDTWTWMKGEQGPEPAPVGYKGRLLGLSPEKEAKLLE